MLPNLNSRTLSRVSGVVLSASLVLAGSAKAQSTAPANPQAVVVEGHARFSVLAPQLIRMEWSPDSQFEDRASMVFINRSMPVPAFTHEAHGKGAARRLTIHTAALDLSYTPLAEPDGRFSARSVQVSFALNGKEVIWHPGLADSGNLLGTLKTLDGVKGSATKTPIEPGIISKDGWTVVDDTARPLFDSTDFSFAKGVESPWPWVIARPAGDRQDLYFFGYGHDYKQALGDFVKVAGRIPLPPRYAFGAWWSRFWSYSDQEFEALVDGFKANDVPLDVLVIDMGWHPTNGFRRDVKDQAGQRKDWTGYTWNKLLFPKPEEFLDHIHAQGLKTTLNLHPLSGVQPWEERYPEMARAMGIDPATQKYVPFDITNKKFALNYMNILHHPLERQGVDFWWLDWQSDQGTPIAGLTPTWWLNYVHFTDQEREGKRPLLFHRWGGLGNHRYEIGFSGDTSSDWPSLAFQPWFTATAANVGYAYWSHDIGGHIPGNVETELYTRWIQFGTFSPILRTHTTSNPDAERRIWANPEPYSDVMRSAFQLRYALQPYIYTEARRTYDTGVAFLRPLYYDWPESPEAYTSRGEYMFGDSMLLAPITKPADPATQLASEDVWLPAGEWIEWFTGRHVTGPVAIPRNFSISQIPVYLRAGAIVPMMPKMEYTGEKPVDPLIVNVFPMADGERSSYKLYEDSGKADEYKNGACSWTTLAASRHGDEIEIVVKPVEGGFDGMLPSRGYEIRLPGDWPPASVTVDGVAAGWGYEGNKLTTIVPVAKHSVHETVTIAVRRSPELERRSAELDGFAGEMTRSFDAADAVNHAGLGALAPDSLIELFQTGDRLTYTPALAGAEIARLPAMYQAALADVQSLLAAAEAGQSADVLLTGGRRANDVDAQQHRNVFLRRAVAILQDARPAPPR